MRSARVIDEYALFDARARDEDVKSVLTFC